MLTAIEYNSVGEQGATGEKTKTINHHGEMRVIKLEEESKEGDEGQAAIEKPGPAWRPLEEGGGNSLGCFTTWGLSLKSVRKYWINHRKNCECCPDHSLTVSQIGVRIVHLTSSSKWVGEPDYPLCH